MSILVKGNEMPKNCDECILRDGIVKDCDKAIFRCAPLAKWVMPNPLGRANDCPLVEVDDNEIDEAIKALKGVRAAHRIITEVFCRPPETDIGSKPK